MKRQRIRDLSFKVGALGASIMLWLSLVNDPIVQRTISVPIEYINTPPGLEISSEVPDRMQLEVEGPRRRVAALDDMRPAVTVSLSSDLNPGQRTFTVTEREVKLPLNVRLVRSHPRQLRLTLDRRASREVPVQVRFAGPPPVGYRIKSVLLKPERVRITGPEGHVQRIDQAETDPINLTSVVSEKEFRVQTFSSDPQVAVDGSAVVSVRVALEKI